jgi:hypothetical protein
MKLEKTSSTTLTPVEEAKEIIATLRKCRSRLNKLQLDHAAVYTDIAIQLLKQVIATKES